METLATTQPSRKRGATSRLRLMAAYKAVFSGHGSIQDAEIVLSDLATFTGFYRVTTADTPNEATKFQEGQRWAFSRILDFLQMPPSEQAALERAARIEASTIYDTSLE